MSRRSLLTPLGATVVFALLGSFAVGWWLGWIEFVAVAVGCALALLIAMPFVFGGHALDLVREVAPLRVEVGGVATSVLTIRNNATRATAPRVIEDRIGSSLRIVDVPGLSPGSESQAISTLPTGRRGVIEIGPAVVAKGDPLGLLRRDLGRTDVERLWIYPRFVPLSPMHSGFVRDLEGPTHDSSPAGDIAFHAVREYSPGDDVRHIHWMSTARTGTLMVRHYVDNRRPYLGIIVDASPSVMSEEHFEVALEVVASHIVSADLEGRPLAAWVGTQPIVSKTDPAGRNDALERLCVSTQSDDAPPPADLYDRVRRTDSQMSALILVTGAITAEDALPVVSAARRHGGVVVFRVVDEGEPVIGVPGARVFDISNLSQFASAWAGIAR